MDDFLRGSELGRPVRRCVCVCACVRVRAFTPSGGVRLCVCVYVDLPASRVSVCVYKPHYSHSEEYHSDSSRGSDLSDIMEEDEDELYSEMQLEEGRRRNSHNTPKVQFLL